MLVCQVLYSGQVKKNLPKGEDSDRVGEGSFCIVWFQISKSVSLGCSFGNLIPVGRWLASIGSMAVGCTVDPSHIIRFRESRFGSASMLC